MGSELRKELQKFLSAINVFASKTEDKPEDQPIEKTDAEIKVTDMTVGGKVELIGKDNELQPIPDGKYTVEDKAFTVKDGFIASIEGEETPAEDANEGEFKAEETATGETVVEPKQDEFA